MEALMSAQCYPESAGNIDPRRGAAARGEKRHNLLRLIDFPARIPALCGVRAGRPFFTDGPSLFFGTGNNADSQSVGAQCPGSPARQEQGARARRLAAEARRMHAGVYDHAEEAQLGAAQGRQGAPHQRIRGDQLHRRRGPQPAGALGGADPRRPGEGLAGRALPHRARQPRYPGRQGPQARALQIRRQEAQGRVVPIQRSSMPRRREIPKREIQPDPKYGNAEVAKFVNVLMTRGKKSIAEHIVYGAFDTIKSKTGKDPLEVFSQAVQNVKPMVEVKSRRVGGANYQVPVEVRPVRRAALSMRWIREAAQKRGEKSMDGRLAGELMEAAEGRGGAMKRREEVHRMAEANKAFAHYRF